MRESKMRESLYHFTYGHKIYRILKDKALIPKSQGDHAPLLWFSRRKHWEPTATKPELINGRTVEMTFRQARDRHDLFRFEWVANPQEMMTFRQACEYDGTGSRQRKAMIKHGRAIGASEGDWLASPTEVRLRQLKVCIYEKNAWRPIRLSDYVIRQNSAA